MRILAAVVTHNRRDLLARCIDHLERQSRAPDEILVINNASTDGTEEMLRSCGVSFITQANLGSAGGWRTGIQHALDNGFDAVWLMDDDGYPDGDALATLESAMTPGTACASSVVMREDMPARFVFPVAQLDRRGLPVIFGAPRKMARIEELRRIAGDGTYPFAYLFNGALIRTDAVRIVGNVNSEYYMFGDDVDYLFRLRDAGKTISVLDAIHFHPDVSQRPITEVKFYYYLKNTLILNARYFNWAPMRNVLAVLAVLGRTAKRNGLLTALSYLSGHRAPVLYGAILRGLRGEIGADFAR